MKLIDVKLNTYFDFEVEFKDKGPKFEVGDYVRMSKHKNVLWKRLYAKFV